MALLVQNALGHLKVKYKDVKQKRKQCRMQIWEASLLRKNLRVQSRKSISKICILLIFSFLLFVFLYWCLQRI